jgi:PIN domain nuclease of toxin-antitoxin system
MRVLLDTHAFLWFIEDHPRLSARATSLIEHASTDALVSAASLWELAIKYSLGKLQVQGSFGTLLLQQLAANDIELLAIAPVHIVDIVSLPYHNRDPFDRMLVAQAIVEQIPIISADTVLDQYPVTRIW